MIIGKNTPSSELLAGFVERLENLAAQKKALSGDEALVLAEAKASGFVPRIIKAVLKVRKAKPSEREEAQSLLDSYLHALGLDREPPLFRHVANMGVDIASREQVIEALKSLVPENGSIIVDVKGAPVRLVRADDGSVTVTDYIPPRPAQSGSEPSRKTIEREPVPDVDGEGAEALGAEAFRADAPIVSNPFPFGDERRPRWDLGWRRASGGDGMGPER